MNRLARLGIASRIFCVAAILGLSLALLDRTSLRGIVIIAAVAALAIAADISLRVSPVWVTVPEGIIAAAAIGFALPHGVLLLPYLVVPAMLAGVVSGMTPVVVVICGELVAMAVLAGTAGAAGGLVSVYEVAAPWLLTALGIGAVGAWLRKLGLAPRMPTGDDSYESARRLLTQLRTVARRLSSGLDTVSMSSQLLITVHQHLADTQSSVFVRTEGGVLAPLGFRGSNAKQSMLPEGPLVDRCWAEMEPVHDVQASGSADRRYRTALPMRVGSRMIGVVIADAGNPPSEKALHALMREVDEQSLRIDTALAFDEVRSIATIEERQRLAREIHDGVAQEIASLGYAVDDLASTASTPEQRKRLQSLRGELSRVVSELRLSIFDLRSEISAGLGSALSDYVREVGARSGLTVHLTLDVGTTRLRSEVELELLRIAQEAITNARKHSEAENLWVNCRIRPPLARIEVRDDGRGLGAARDDSYGLRIMRERSERIGATLEISDGRDTAGPDGQYHTGTTVTVTVGAEHPADHHHRRSRVHHIR
ncbi:MAG TPA: histidine kinase [Nocardioidaceae bacterium]|nr:histidine kinase [Nocardioidaceae bacterium]